MPASLKENFRKDTEMVFWKKAETIEQGHPMPIWNSKICERNEKLPYEDSLRSLGLIY